MAEPVVFIPGLLCTGALFQAQIDALSKDREVSVADHTRADTMAGIARQILDDAPPRFALAGLSMGVPLAFEVFALAPERVSRLALINGRATPDTPEIAKGRRELMNMAAEGRFKQVTTEVLIHRLVATHRVHEPGLRETIVKMADDVGAQAFARQQTALIARRDYRPEIKNITCPAISIGGELDILTKPEGTEEIASLMPNCRLEILNDCGHLAPLEKPGEVTELLRDWLIQN